MTALRIVVAPDSFKGSATATRAAHALADGWHRTRPQDQVVTMPMADGGEGTLDAFASAQPAARRMPVVVTGPDGRDIRAYWLLLPDGTGVVELASTSGLTLLDELIPGTAHTFGFGQAIADAMRTGVDRLLLAIGGSASTDGGGGALIALGARLLDQTGQAIPLGNDGLARLTSVDLADLVAPPPGGVRILSDVTNPLLGPNGAAAVFGPQKGATVAQVPVLDRNLARLAALLDAEPSIPGSGAAGGTGLALLTWGAELVSGAAAVGDALGLPAALVGADVALTGEGRFDTQSEAGKAPDYVRDQALRAGAVPLLVAGDIAAPTALFSNALSLTELAGSPAEARTNATRWLEAAGAKLAALPRWDAEPTPHRADKT